MSHSSRALGVLAGLLLIPLAPAAANAASGGAAVSSSSSSATASADPILTRAVALTRRQVRSVQRRVDVKPDGVIGARTRSAIRRYQSRHDLTRTGRPNVETLREMGLKLADRLEAKLRAEPQLASAAGASGAAQGALAAARSAIGTPYAYGGRSLSGFDCSGLVSWAFEQADVDLPRTSFAMWGEGDRVPMAEARAGDLVFFDSAGSGASHVGIATSATTVISATSSRGVIEHPFDRGYWRSHYVGVRRLAG